jgi:hypothetical protein
MESIHCVKIAFEQNQECYAKKTGDKKKLLRDSLMLPIIVNKSDKRSMKLSSTSFVKPEESEFLVKANETQAVGSMQKELTKRKAQAKLIKKPIYESAKYYMKFYDKIEKEQLKRLGKKEKARTQERNNPWRYSIASVNSVFDVTQLAESIFKPSFRRTS